MQLGPAPGAASVATVGAGESATTSGTATPTRAIARQDLRLANPVPPSCGQAGVSVGDASRRSTSAMSSITRW